MFFTCSPRVLKTCILLDRDKSQVLQHLRGTNCRRLLQGLNWPSCQQCLLRHVSLGAVTHYCWRFTVGLLPSQLCLYGTSLIYSQPHSRAIHSFTPQQERIPQETPAGERRSIGSMLRGQGTIIAGGHDARRRFLPTWSSAGFVAINYLWITSQIA